MRLAWLLAAGGACAAFPGQPGERRQPHPHLKRGSGWVGKGHKGAAALGALASSQLSACRSHPCMLCCCARQRPPPPARRTLTTRAHLPAPFLIAGHVLPGVVLIIWGSWWAYNVCLRYLASRRGTPYRASAWCVVLACAPVRVAACMPLPASELGALRHRQRAAFFTARVLWQRSLSTLPCPANPPSHPYAHPASPNRFPMSNRWVKYLEPAIKVILPPIAVSIELYFDHPDGFQ